MQQSGNKTAVRPIQKRLYPFIVSSFATNHGPAIMLNTIIPNCFSRLTSSAWLQEWIKTDCTSINPNRRPLLKNKPQQDNGKFSGFAFFPYKCCLTQSITGFAANFLVQMQWAIAPHFPLWRDLAWFAPAANPFGNQCNRCNGCNRCTTCFGRKWFLFRVFKAYFRMLLKDILKGILSKLQFVFWRRFFSVIQ